MFVLLFRSLVLAIVIILSTTVTAREFTCFANLAEGELVRQAIVYAKEKHKGTLRKFEGQAYMAHPVRVANLVKQWTSDPVVIAAAFLHDTLEDTVATYDELVKYFGKEVADLVDELSSDPKLKEKFGKANYLAKKMKGMSTKALLVKLADRVDNTSFFELAPSEWVKKYALETEFILRDVKKRNDLTEAHRAFIAQIENTIRPFLDPVH